MTSETQLELIRMRASAKANVEDARLWRWFADLMEDQPVVYLHKGPAWSRRSTRRFARRLCSLMRFRRRAAYRRYEQHTSALRCRRQLVATVRQMIGIAHLRAIAGRRRADALPENGCEMRL